MTDATKAKRNRKIKSEINLNSIKLSIVMGEGIEPSRLEFNTADLPQESREVLMSYGATTRLVNAASGKEGHEAVEAVNTAWHELLQGKWSPRKPAEQTISVSALKKAVDSLPSDIQGAVREALLGESIPA